MAFMRAERTGTTPRNALPSTSKASRLVKLPSDAGSVPFKLLNDSDSVFTRPSALQPTSCQSHTGLLDSQSLDRIQCVMSVALAISTSAARSATLANSATTGPTSIGQPFLQFAPAVTSYTTRTV
jgi:hypothetical protein